MIKNWIAAFSAAALIAGCADNKTDNYQALHLEYIDSSVNPADDFYNFVNGKWMKTAVIPADRGRWGAFEQLDKMADSMSLAVLEDALKTKKYDAKTDQGKAVTLFSSVLDTVNRNKQGVEPLKPYLTEIDQLKTLADLNAWTNKYLPYGESTLTGFYIGADEKNSNKNAVYVYPASMGLPDRDYYLKTDAESAELQKKYRQFVSAMLQEFGTEAKEADAQAERIYNFEKKLATPRLSKEERRDPVRQYNPRSAAEVSALLSKLDVGGFLKTLKINPDTLIVNEPAYCSAMNQLLTEANMPDIKLLLKWGTIRGAASSLNDKLENMSFGFYGTTMRGTPAMKPRSERALDVVNGSVGEALGKLYVDKYFPAEAKTKAKELVDDLIAAYRVRITNLDWMSETTKKKALSKLSKITVKIGYPDKWRDYSQLDVSAFADGGSYFQNMMNVSKFSVWYNMSKFGKPVDKAEWGMSPQTVNAYYNPSYNEIVFPAAILQAPFFDFRADDAVNYGGIGAVIGHEISHGFDDQGAQYDENGNLMNWWTEEDLAKFQEKGKALAAQYSAYEALPGKFVNGPFTLGENIGDLGGIFSAFEALQISMKRKGEADPIDGHTWQQRFFMSWATVWRNKIRDKELETRLNLDPHSPGYFRAIGPLQNHEGFYAAFNVKPGDKMYRADSVRVKIW